MPKIRAALEGDRWLELPDRFDIHEWSIMERFSRAQKIERIRSELLNVIHGTGAFRAFRSAIRRLGLEQSWYQFRDETLADIARRWLEEHKVQYTLEVSTTKWVVMSGLPVNRHQRERDRWRGESLALSEGGSANSRLLP